MNRPRERNAKSTGEKPKRSYNKPKLQVYGDLRQITQNKGKATKKDNPAKSGTHLG